MIVFRLSRKKYKDVLSGYGAALNGQRWNSKGTELIYTVESRALACSEVAVHLPLGILPKDYYMVEIEIPDNLPVQKLPENDLPNGWNALPALPISRRIGDEMVRQNKLLALGVPSAVIKGDYNYIINPIHSDFEKIKIINTTPFPFDHRFFF
jgi:RES domain-containing protein